MTWDDFVTKFKSSSMDERRGNQAQKMEEGKDGMKEEDADDMDEVQWWIWDNGAWSQITPGSRDGFHPSGEQLIVTPLGFIPRQASRYNIACSVNNPFSSTPKTSYRMFNQRQVRTDHPNKNIGLRVEGGPAGFVNNYNFYI